VASFRSIPSPVPPHYAERGRALQRDICALHPGALHLRLDTALPDALTALITGLSTEQEA